MTRIVSFPESGVDLGALHCAMLAAFSDYVVPLQPDADTFKAALRSRGFDPAASFVAVDDGEVIGFWKVATRNNQRYLIGSGTRIGHRGRGLASRLGMAAIRAAENTGSESFWLEVIEGNEGAERLYRKLGFEVTRKLDCYRLDHPSPDPSTCERSDFGTVANAIQTNSTWKPTWQNATETISGSPLTCFLHEKGGAIVGAGGLVHQIAASDPSALADLLAATATVGSLTLVNVESADSVLCSLLKELGADRFGCAVLTVVARERMFLSLANRHPQANRRWGAGDLCHGIFILPEEIGTAEPPIRTVESSPFFNTIRA